ncbi:hypothetical protein K437DRAFT_49277 [Tilletiaria anomala UBC 951]|uniref:Uncharacterized protein n=1 Tax=Tilletiaria anomala (strain ATCC 24038 / CBS 436.72 / UBC 951) TaxID=1037660 RepID=A0A066V5K5_TILAU|nr:uncharacterized protein K437DRAFT_49277 [Tilletiaria anomala UBC 951]KDN36746.1 hypothetical protein K437DRAFT_49277 [Tilletiaria anomala UBC 951]
MKSVKSLTLLVTTALVLISGATSAVAAPGGKHGHGKQHRGVHFDHGKHDGKYDHGKGHGYGHWKREPLANVGMIQGSKPVEFFKRTPAPAPQNDFNSGRYRGGRNDRNGREREHRGRYGHRGRYRDECDRRYRYDYERRGCYDRYMERRSPVPAPAPVPQNNAAESDLNQQLEGQGGNQDQERQDEERQPPGRGTSAPR